MDCVFIRKCLPIICLTILISPIVNAGPVAYMGLYADAGHSECSVTVPAPYVGFTCWHWVLPGSDGVKCVDYMIEIPAFCFNIGTTYNPVSLAPTGDPLNGVSICFDECQTDWVWTCQVNILPTAVAADIIRILPHPDTGTYQVLTCEEGFPAQQAIISTDLCINQDCWNWYNPPLLYDVEVISPSCLKAHFTTCIYDWGRTYKDQLRFYLEDTPEDSIIVVAATKIYTEDRDQKLLIHLDSPMETGVQYELSVDMCCESWGCAHSTWPVTFEESYTGMADLAVTYMLNYETDNYGQIGSDECIPAEFNIRVNNTGTVHSGPFSIGIYMGSVEIPGTGIYVDTIYCPNIPASSIIYESVSVNIPPGIMTYHNELITVADCFAEVDEWSEDNNSLKVGFNYDNPEIISITDVPSDYGGWVDVSFRASFHEIEYQQATDFYAILRLDPLTDEWAPVATIDAIGDTFYTVEAPTLADDSETEFMVRILSGHYIYSCSKLGYSIDNLIAIAMALEDSSALFDGSLIIVSWTLSSSSVSEDIDFEIYCSKSGGAFEIMSSAEVVNEDNTYSISDPDVISGNYYRYRVEYIENSEKHILFETENIKVPVKPMTLGQNKPNPFNPTTEISYFLPQAAQVSLEIFNAVGRRVRALVNETQPSGQYQIEWNGRADSGARVASGVYFYRLRAGKETLTRKMVLMR